jgi:tetratricopeptide (TPR) repeat protein
MAEAEVLALANEAFEEEEYAKALELYTQVLWPKASAIIKHQLNHARLTAAAQASELEPLNAAVWGARAHAHIKLEQYREAAADAGRAIELDPGLARAYLRKG